MTTEVEREPAASSDAPASDPVGDSAGDSVGDLARDATRHLSTLIRGEVELAKLELTASVRRLGWSTAFFGAAATLLFFSLFFPFIALAEGLVALGLPRWGAYLVAWGVLVLLALAAGFVGVRIIRRIRKPERTLRAVRDTAALARHPTQGGARTPAGPDRPAG